jgi:hypothetical protein
VSPGPADSRQDFRRLCLSGSAERQNVPAVGDKATARGQSGTVMIGEQKEKGYSTTSPVYIGNRHILGQWNEQVTIVFALYSLYEVPFLLGA